MPFQPQNVFHFTELEKLCFFLKPDLIRKEHLVKPKALLSIMVTIMVVTMVIVSKG